MMKWKLMAVLAVAAGCGAPETEAEQPQGPRPGELTLDAIFGKNSELRAQDYGEVLWLEHRIGYTRLVEEKGAQSLVHVLPASGIQRPLIGAEELRPPGTEGTFKIDAHAFSQDGSRLLLFTNTRRVWRKNTRGDYWTLDLSSGAWHKLGGEAAPEASLMFAKFSPDGDRVAYVRGNDLFVEDLVEGKITRLTEGGSATNIHGTFDWVYEEEFRCRDGFRWSPDGEHLLFWHFDATGIGAQPLVRYTDTLYPEVTWLPYPKAGEQNSACRLGVVPATGGEPTWLQLPIVPREHYVPYAEWIGEDGKVLVQVFDRLQQNVQVLVADAAGGTSEVVFEDRDDCWVQFHPDLHVDEAGESFLWLSERDGWRHLYRVRLTGEVELLTPGPYDVESVAGQDAEAGWIYVTASPQDPTQRFLLRVPAAGGPAVRVTPRGLRGDHAYDIAPDGRAAIHRHSTFDAPPVVELIELPSHEVRQRLVGNEHVTETYAEVERGRSDFFRVDIGKGVSLDGWVRVPPDFDPSRKYPVLFYVYGEPAGQTVRDRWGGDRALWHTLLTQKGYVVASIDPRGTPAPRGREWRKAVYRRIGSLNSGDHVSGVRALLERHPWMDPERVGIWGWSGGGSSTLQALFRYPEVYRVGISVAPVTSSRFYDTIYTERYMGLPGDHYDACAALSHAAGLQGELFLIHGTADDNVHFQNAEVLADALIAAGKEFRYLPFPDRAHGLREKEGTRRYLFGLMTQFLLEELPPGPR